ncbi:hypothetical protein CYMTET_49495 [Cymbomonas tetramitiformis]|uniref:Galactose oxidase n=1 Tax=Cymbomonas tetramitiformis TaxID=36881 RepID=A0AAE0EUH4_9CHLO|nr:hypothetical protein CYMTET_49495 [Cymbomonas tetramitiformis]
MVVCPGHNETSTFVVFGGETDATSEHKIARRLSDTWILDTDLAAEGSHPWKKIASSTPSTQPTPRSNHTAFRLGKYMLVFGGWHVSGQYPLQELELFDLEARHWSAAASTGYTPSARGNPTSVVWKSEAILFGGWDKEKRYNDIHVLDASLNWTTRSPSSDERPAERTDHSAVLWAGPQAGGASMVVFGGSTNEGAQNDTWLLDIKTWTWRQLDTMGKAPAARTSHAAVCLDDAMLICGGVGQYTAVETPKMWGNDCYLLNLRTSSWSMVVRSPCAEVPRMLTSPLCRHTMVAISPKTIMVYGGYDGARNLPVLFQARLSSSETKSAADPPAKRVHIPVEGDRPSVLPRSPTQVTSPQTGGFGAPAPKASSPTKFVGMFTAAHLPADQRALSGNKLVRALHKAAVDAGAETYQDPATGYSVFTSLFLKKRACCGNKCRHCPWGHKNVPKLRGGADTRGNAYDW